MSRIDFYHLQKQTLDEVLPKLLQKAYATGKKILVKVGTEERVEFINNWLWCFNDESFLPHGSKKDGFANQQPIWITADDANANNAEFLFLVDGAVAEVGSLQNYERVFNIFDGNAEAALQQAREQWKKYKEAAFDVHYWQQNNAGTWENKM
ncbi:MAG: DNA polymerase III subunit chi [Alphaproteobacteria bacterium]|nr:DNA polymerase III subunit chi [Alphaproteobacteria bacterium]